METDHVTGIGLDRENRLAPGFAFRIGAAALFHAIFAFERIFRGDFVIPAQSVESRSAGTLFQQIFRPDLQLPQLCGHARCRPPIVFEKFHGTDLQSPFAFERIEPEFPDAGGLFPGFERGNIRRRQRDLFPVPFPVADITAQIDINSGKRLVLIAEKIDFPLIAGRDRFRSTVLEDEEVVICRFHVQFVKEETGVVPLGPYEEDAVLPFQIHSGRTAPFAEIVVGVPFHDLSRSQYGGNGQKKTKNETFHFFILT